MVACYNYHLMLFLKLNYEFNWNAIFQLCLNGVSRIRLYCLSVSLMVSEKMSSKYFTIPLYNFGTIFKLVLQ